MNDLVSFVDGVAVVSSDDVARKFGKVHRDVMDAMHRIKKSKDAEDFWRVNFHTSTYMVRGKDYDCYLMTRDGFSLLAMGFTGSEAMKWKISYINAFNEMEKGLVNADSRINKLTIEGRQIKQAGKEWSEFGHEIRRQKKAHSESVDKLMSDVQFKLELK